MSPTTVRAAKSPSRRQLERGQFVKRNLPYLALAFCVFAITAFCACTFSVDECPDEYMRYPIARYIFDHGCLPVGGDEEIRSSIFGFSYGFTPYLPSIIGALFMKVTSLFTNSESALFISARFVSVLSITGFAFVSCKIGDALFSERRAGVLCGVIASCTPQVLFLGSYCNCDALVLFSVALMVLAWAKATTSRSWTRGMEVMLAIGVAICALTYYNAYGFILASIFIYVATSIAWKRGARVTIRGFVFVSVIVIVLAGWFFVRNAIIYDGDFLAMKTMYAYGEEFGSTEWKPSNRDTMAAQGLTFFQAFIDTDYQPSDFPWVSSTMKSFLCLTGYMTHWLPNIAFRLFLLVIAVGCFVAVVGVGVRAIGSHARREASFHGSIDVLMICSLIGASAITIALAMYYSYFTDYQPQGRYIITCILPLALLMTSGYTFLEQALKSLIARRSNTASQCLFALCDPRVLATVAWIAISLWCIAVCFPPCFAETVFATAPTSL